MKKLMYILMGIITILIVIIALNDKSVKFKEYHFNDYNFTINKTDYVYLDTLAHVGLDQLNLKHIIIQLKPIPKDFEIKGFDINAFIRGSGNVYVIYFKEGMGKMAVIKTMAHELIHLQQFYEERLIETPTYWIWENDTINDVSTIPYFEREWEIEAFLNSIPLRENILNEILSN